MSDLVYPYSEIPAFGTIFEVASGVYWVRMPLPMSLDHINLYMLEDDDGWWIVDTGIKTQDITRHWQTIFENELKGKPIKGVLITHMHPDHIGQAGWICEKFRVPMYMTFGEYYSARTYAKSSAEDLQWTNQAYYRGAGFDDNYLELMKANYTGYAAFVEPIPSSFIRLSEGMILTIAGKSWQVAIGSGHSPEHACFFCEELDVMLSGDQIIPRITSNVSVSAAEPEGNPLKDWMFSLEKFFKFPDSALILPAHNTPFVGLHARLKFLIEHHKDHLLALEEACVAPRTAMSLLPVLFKRALDDSHKSMAVGECVAHLNYLMYENKLQRNVDSDGVYHYRSIDPTLADRAQPGSHHQDELPLQV
ncbi:MAG: MBL fold metallo-hydrolase [Oceanicoccus sp.]